MTKLTKESSTSNKKEGRQIKRRDGFAAKKRGKYFQRIGKITDLENMMIFISEMSNEVRVRFPAIFEERSILLEKLQDIKSLIRKRRDRRKTDEAKTVEILRKKMTNVPKPRVNTKALEAMMKELEQCVDGSGTSE